MTPLQRPELAEPTDRLREDRSTAQPDHSCGEEPEWQERHGADHAAGVDLTFSIADFTRDRQHQHFAQRDQRARFAVRAIYPRSISRTELNADPIVGGNVAAIRKSLQRWVGRG